MAWISAASRLAYAREASWGTRPEAFGGTGGSGSANPRFIGITNQGIEFPDKELDVRQYRSFGHGRDFYLTHPGKVERAGALSFVPTNAEFLRYVFGQDTFTAGTPNVHVLSVLNSAVLPSFALGAALEGIPDFLRVFLGCIVDSCEFTLDENGELQLSVGYFCKDVVDEELVTPTLFTQPTNPFTDAPYMFYDAAATIKIGGAYDFGTNIYTGGRTIGAVKGFTCSIKNNLKRNFAFGGGQDVFRITPGYIDVDLSLQIQPSGKLSGDTDSIYDLLEDESRYDVIIPFQRSATDRLDLVFDDVIMRSAPHNWPEDGNEITVSTTFVPESIRAVSYDSLADYDTL